LNDGSQGSQPISPSRVIDTFVGAVVGRERTVQLREAIQRGLAQAPAAKQK